MREKKNKGAFHIPTHSVAQNNFPKGKYFKNLIRYSTGIMYARSIDNVIDNAVTLRVLLARSKSFHFVPVDAYTESGLSHAYSIINPLGWFVVVIHITIK